VSFAAARTLTTSTRLYIARVRCGECHAHTHYHGTLNTSNVANLHHEVKPCPCDDKIMYHGTQNIPLIPSMSASNPSWL
jgi:hypothetical protein